MLHRAIAEKAMPSSVPIVRTIAGLRTAIAQARTVGQRVALVPTMGALHEGHLSLCRLAAERASFVVVSIFVNPAQFAPHEDLATYPRSEASDVAKLLASGTTSLIYAPSASEMYPDGFATSIVPRGVADGLETDFRPHFFCGVATVVAKLFAQVTPDLAVFGEKDYQQLQVIKQLVRDLNLNVEIIPGPTHREADGLALSSRNAYLDVHSRKIAGALNAIMHETATAVANGADIITAQSQGRAKLIEAGFDSVDYFDIRDASTLGAVRDRTEPMRLLAAVKIGNTRLIDNMAV